MKVERQTQPHPEPRTHQLDPARTSGSGSALLASPEGLCQPAPLIPAPAPLQVHALPGLTLDLVNDAPQSPFYLPTLQPILPPNEDEVKEQQEEER